MRFRSLNEGFLNTSDSMILLEQLLEQHCPICRLLLFRGHANLNLSPMSSGNDEGYCPSILYLPEPCKEGTDRPERASPMGTCTRQTGLLLTCKTWAEPTHTRPPSAWWAPAPGSPILSTVLLAQLFAGKILENGGQNFPYVTAGEASPGTAYLQVEITF